MNTTRVAAWFVTLHVALPAFGSGLLIPEDSAIPPLAIQSLRVSTTIDRQIATTHIEQVFINHTDRDLEAKYVFPLPANATIREFSMLIDGKIVKGELVEKQEAQRVYEGIVARMRDPGLLEYLGNNLFRVRVFPVRRKAEQRIDLTYSESLPQHAGLVQYTFPLRTGQQASRTMKDFTVSVKIKSPIAIKSIYSPSHQDLLSVTRKGDNEATVGLEAARYVLDRDFQLFYSMSDKNFGLDLACYRPNPAEPGYFMMLIAPSSEVNADQRVPRDMCFVFDVSGSMRGEKIEQARKALRHCIDKLHADDRFNLITFSTDVTPMAREMLPANDENRNRARSFIDKIEANGGTNIHEALLAALDLPVDPARPRVVIFMTDGQPTVGKTTDPEILAVAVPSEEAKRSRVFVFGVGDDVNTHLLDQIGGKTGGVTEYVRPQEAIDIKVGQFFDKASYPVLADLNLQIGDQVQTSEVYPRKLGDLYRGSQLTMFGRYAKAGHVAVTLTGRLRQGTEKFVYECSFPEKTEDNAFIEPIWANRKVGYLLDEIRLHGQNKELVDEVTRLGMKYSIQTPYTSFLVVPESEKQLAAQLARRPAMLERSANLRDLGVSRDEQESLMSRHGGRGGLAGGTAGAPGDAARPDPKARPRDAVGPMIMDRSEPSSPDESTNWFADEGRNMSLDAGRAASRPSRAFGRAKSAAPAKLNETSGKDAVSIAMALSDLKGAVTETKNAGLVRTVAGRKFFLIRGVWVDEQLTDKTPIVEIKFGGKAYFALAAHKEFRDILKLGQYVIVVTPSGQAIFIGDSGKEELPPDDLTQLMTAKPATRPAGP